MPFMSFAKYAKHRGVTRGAVNKALKEGRITPVVGPEGKVGLNSEQADAEWSKNSQPRSNFQPPTDAAANPIIEEFNAMVNDTISPEPKGTEYVSYNDARTEKEALQAKLLQLKYDELSGKLVPAEEVEQKWADIATRIKNKVLGVASKLKQRHPEISLETYASLDAILREALEELANETN